MENVIVAIVTTVIWALSMGGLVFHNHPRSDIRYRLPAKVLNLTSLIAFWMPFALSLYASIEASPSYAFADIVTAVVQFMPVIVLTLLWGLFAQFEFVREIILYNAGISR